MNEIKPEDYKEIVAYNNLSAFKRVILSPMWCLGAGAGLLTYGFNSVARGKKYEQDHRSQQSSKLYTNNAFGYASIANFGVDLAFSASTAASVLNGVMVVGLVAGVVGDALGSATGRSFGALRAGYKQCKYGMHVPDPKTDPNRDLIM